MLDALDALRESLAPNYDIERQIGAGGMARVFLAVEQHPHRRVAIKVLDPELSARLLRERFIREVDLSSKLSHPHIVPIFSAGEVDGLFYYVMPYVEGESLRHRLVRERKLPLAAALHITRDVADALAFAHAQGIIHRDIKPENILLSGDHAIVADFGIARAISAAGAPTLTQTGQSIGSPGYMSPEQALGTGDLDARTDVYSLGCVLFEMLAGEPPVPSLAERVIHNWGALESSDALRRVEGGVVRAVKHAISKALAPLPGCGPWAGRPAPARSCGARTTGRGIACGFRCRSRPQRTARCCGRSILSPGRSVSRSARSKPYGNASWPHSRPCSTPGSIGGRRPRANRPTSRPTRSSLPAWTGSSSSTCGERSPTSSGRRRWTRRFGCRSSSPRTRT